MSNPYRRRSQKKDEKGAARFVEERVSWAPESKATRTLPALFPRAQQPLPTVNIADLIQQVKPDDMTQFRKHLTANVRFAPTRRGAGWGGSQAEFWFWATRFEEEWEEVMVFLTQLALANGVAAETMEA